MRRIEETTPYAELNEVLSFLVNGAVDALQDNFVGTYLQGSFAIGDHTEYSDCDFMIVTRRDLSELELDSLQQHHRSIQQLPCSYWHVNIEGSYAPQDILRKWSTEPRDPPGEPRDDSWGDPGMDGAPARCYPFWFLSHGSDTLVRSEHDNSRVDRWSLRERGIRLIGPDITELIDPVPADELRAEVRATMDIAMATGLHMPVFALQAFWVGLFCRILHTIETGEVTSKKAALTWAYNNLDPTWRELIALAMTLRKGDEDQAGASITPQLGEQTRLFAQECRITADRMLNSRTTTQGLSLEPNHIQAPEDISHRS